MKEKSIEKGIRTAVVCASLVSLGLGTSACSYMDHQQSPDGYDVNVDSEDD